MEKEELLELIKGMREDDRKRLADASIPAAGEERFVPVRNGRARILYYPAEAGAPVFINVHGGGFVAGVPEGDDLFCKRVNEQLKIHVVNVEYRLAPEVMFPGDKEDVYDVVSYLCGHPEEYPVDVNRMIIGGHSAGANISTAVCLMAKETGDFRFLAQILDYPPLDLFTPAGQKFYTEGAIPPQIAEVFNACYRKEEDAKNILCSPYWAQPEELKGLPDALVITCELDSLRDEAEEYAKKLMQAGVEVTGKRFCGAAHGFTMAEDEAGIAGQQYMIDYIKRKLN